jgi:hypothetical protein
MRADRSGVRRTAVSAGAPVDVDNVELDGWRRLHDRATDAVAGHTRLLPHPSDADAADPLSAQDAH